MEPAVGVEDGLLLAAVGVKDTETISSSGEVVVVPGDVDAGVEIIVIASRDVLAGAGVDAVPIPAETGTGDKRAGNGNSTCTPRGEGT